MLTKVELKIQLRAIGVTVYKNTKGVNFIKKIDAKKVLEKSQEIELKAKGLGDIKGIKPGAKDLARMEDIITKSKGDLDKMLKLVTNMAKAITKEDKAQRRAAAALEVLPVEIAVEAAAIFMSKY